MTSIYKPNPRAINGGTAPRDETKCAAIVDRGDHRMSFFGQCSNRIKVRREVDGVEYGFCGHHDPLAVADREAARDAAAAEKRAQLEAADRLRFLRPRDYLAALRRIAAGDNDPRTVAREVLEKWGDQG